MIKKSKLYKLLLNIYLRLQNLWRKFQNLHYNKTVINVLNSGEIENKIRELNNIINTANCEKIYYIIRRDNKSIGLLTYVSIFLGHIAYAVAKGYIPVIDMKNFRSIYLNEEQLGKVNAWELYFEQPCGIALEDLKQTDKIIYSPKYINPISPFSDSLYDDNESKFWKILAKNFVRLNNKTSEYINEELDDLFKNKKVLGLLYRGTDYLSLKPKKHPIQPTIEQFVNQIEKSIEEWGDFDALYLATDEKKVFDILCEQFPGKVLVNKRTYYDHFSDITFLAEASFDRENDHYLKGLEYLSSIKLLSSTNSIIAGLCAGTYAANFMKSNEYKHKFYFKLGVYK